MRMTWVGMAAAFIGAFALGSLLAAEPERPSSANRTLAAGPTRPAPVPGRAPRAANIETAVFAGGCFWCTELAFEQLKGVIDVETGYCGGTEATASYDRVHDGSTRHAESIQVTYDANTIRYDQLLDVFFDAHDPTQLNRQGEDDVGRQYRSAIFFANDQQKRQAEAKIAELTRKKVYKRRIVTRLEPMQAFYPAEDFHQNFALKHPLLPYIQSEAIPKACNVRISHPELLRKAP